MAVIAICIIAGAVVLVVLINVHLACHVVKQCRKERKRVYEHNKEDSSASTKSSTSDSYILYDL